MSDESTGKRAKRRAAAMADATPVLEFLQAFTKFSDPQTSRNAIDEILAAGNEIDACRVYVKQYGQIRNAVGRRMRYLIEGRK